jgi:hypothetical protein
VRRHFALIAFVLAVGLLLATSQSEAGLQWTGANAIVGVKKVNSSGMQFLKIGTSARAAGMGDAFAGVADDINAAFFNGAGLTHIKRLGYSVNYTKWLESTNLYSLAAAWNTGSSRGEVIGFTATMFKPKDMEETTILQPDGTGQTILYSDTAVGLLYAVKFTDKFSFSAKLNFVQEKIYTKTTSTVVFDLGSFFYTGFKSLRVAMSLRNFGPDKAADATKYFMPLYYNMAIASEVYGEKGKPFYVTLDAESAFAVDYEQRYLFGAEAWIHDQLALRAGYKYNYDLEQFSLGVGVRQPFKGDKAVTLDVAYSPLRKVDGIKMFDPILRVSLGGAF